MTSVSFIITVYNKEIYLEKVIDALANQEGNYDREFIFINDGSTDLSLSVIKANQHKLSNCRLVTQQNTGPAKAINHGIALARKKFIKFVDGDDVLLPRATLLLLNAAHSCKTHVAFGMIGTYNPYASLCTATGKTYSTRTIKVTDCLEKVIMGNFRGISSIGMSRGLASRGILEKAGGADENVFIQDYSISLRLAAVAKQFAFVDEVVALQANDGGGRHLSSNTIQERYDTILALYNFSKLHPKLASLYTWHINHRVKKIIAKVAKVNGLQFAKKYFEYIAAKLVRNVSYEEVLEECLKALKWIDTNFKTHLRY